ncbi:thioredoxin family protein [Carboxylicivirga sp. RSCT41]|uniref:thioredoxin family protein n=1 Tax=Carboxylicivirga agarovorans TaxID=3417570 RepID=UPI003D3586B5
MKYLELVLVLIFSIGICSAQEKEGVKFQDISFEQAFELARQEGKKVFVNYSTNGCAPCKMMDLTVYTDSITAEKMNKNFVCIKLDPIKDRSLEKRAREVHQIKGFPTMLFFKADGDMLSKAVGGKDVKEFNQVLDKALSGS